MSGRAPLAVVIAARDEAPRLPALLAQLAAAPQLVAEVWVVDGQSSDATLAGARLAGARVLCSSPGRGLQLLRGIEASCAPWLLLLHADVRLPPGWIAAVSAAIYGPAAPPQAWYFELAVGPAAGGGALARAQHPGLRLVELAVRLRSRWRQRPYGDQGLLLSRELYHRCGGIRPLPLMEDLDLVLRLQRYARLVSLGLPLQVDGRRWRQRGIWRTTWLNWRLRRAWHRGTAAQELVTLYYGSAERGDQGAYQKAQRRCSGSRSHPWPS